jgi:hypothetical protein
MFMKFTTRILNSTTQNLLIELFNENNGEIKRAYEEQDRKSKLEIKSIVGAVFDSLSLDRFADLIEEKE